MRIQLLGLVFLLTLSAVSQDYRHTIEAGYGTSIKAGLIKTALNLKEDVRVEGKPVLVGNYSYRAHSLFGIGIGFTHQKLEGGYQFTTMVQDQQISEKLDFSYLRYAIVAEPRFYYPIKSEVFEFYTALRLGYKREKVEATSTNNNINEILELTKLIARPGINASITPLGINVHPIPNVGFSLAGNIGPTYVARAALTIRF